MATQFNIMNLTGEARTGLEFLRGLPQQLGEILEQTRLQTVQVGLDRSLSLGGKTNRTNEITSRAMAQVDQLEQRAQAYKATLETWIAKRLGKPQGDPQAELLHEIRLDKAWRRAVRILDAVQDKPALVRMAFDLVDAAVKEADGVTIEALDAELPAYFKARNMTTPPELAKQIMAARVVHASPEVRQALALQAELAEGFPRLTLAFREVKRALQTQATIAVLPGWSSTERVALDLPKPEPAGLVGS